MVVQQVDACKSSSTAKIYEEVERQTKEEMNPKERQMQRGIGTHTQTQGKTRREEEMQSQTKADAQSLPLLRLSNSYIF